jgi:chromosome segregation ATPase
MSINIEEIKQKVDEAKEEKAKAEGAMEQIEKQWKDEFDCKTEEEVQNNINKIEADIKDLSEKKETYMTEINTVMEGV